MCQLSWQPLLHVQGRTSTQPSHQQLRRFSIYLPIYSSLIQGIPLDSLESNGALSICTEKPVRIILQVEQCNSRMPSICIKKNLLFRTFLPHTILGNSHVFHQGALVQVGRSKWYNEIPVTLVKTRKEECLYSSSSSFFFFFFLNNFH